MDRKSILIILIIIILAAIIAFMGFGQFFPSEEEHVQVGDVNFTIPQGYQVGGLNSDGDLTLTNGTAYIYLADYNGDDVKPYVDKYKDYVNKTNASVSTSDFTVDDIQVYKAVNEDKGAEHFWFVKDNKVYTVYVWSNHPGIDDTIIDIIKSANTSA